MSDRWDVTALREGASVAVLLAVPPTLIARFLVDDQEQTSGWAPLLLFVAVTGFLLGGGVAAWRQQRGTPLSHGVAVAAGVFVVVQAVFLVIRASTGGDIQVGRMLVSFSFATVAGLVGGLLGSFLQRSGIQPRR